jgi:hypothetical protein
VTVLAFYFGWYAGAVWSNLLASVICVGVAWWRLRARMITHHAEQLAQAARHHAERLKLAGEQHEALKAHVTAAVAASRPASRQPKTLAAKPPKGAGA